MSRVEDFKKELKTLMEKYNASINFDVDDCSDTYGIYGESMYLVVDNEDIKICNTWGFDASDL